MSIIHRLDPKPGVRLLGLVVNKDDLVPESL